MTRTAQALLFVWALAGAIACSSGSPAPIGSQTTVPPMQTGTSSADGGRASRDSASGTTGAADASAPSAEAEAGVASVVTCNSIDAEGKVVEELAVAGEIPPPLAGKVEPGTYVLLELDDYPGEADAGGTTGLAARKSLVLGSTTYRLADAEGTGDAGVGSSTITGGTYSVDGTTLTRKQQCPSVATLTNDYSASGSQLGLYDGTHFEVYELQTPP